MDIDELKALFMRGNRKLATTQVPGLKRIAIIGSRHPDEQGLAVAYKLGRKFSHYIVVSGLARGIDTSAHLGCLDGGGLTIAVVGTGLDRVYPPENITLVERILNSNGLIVTEQPLGTKASPRTLIARTRIQMLLADEVYVVECERQSGTMYAVNNALNLGIPIYALDCDWSGNRYLIDNNLGVPYTD